jgi:hypothetical protein
MSQVCSCTSACCCATPPETTTNVYYYQTQASQLYQGLLTHDGSEAVLPYDPIGDAAVVVMINGVAQRQGTDYTISDTTITFTPAIPADAVVYVILIKATS